MAGWIDNFASGTVQDAIKTMDPILTALEAKAGGIINLAVSQMAEAIKEEREALQGYLNGLTIEVHATFTIKEKSNESK